MPRRGRLRRAFNRATGRTRRGVARAAEAVQNFFGRRRLLRRSPGRG
jgi:hypothetical protein